MGTSTRRGGTTLLAAIVILVALNATPVRGEDVYLDKMNKTLGDWWNMLDNVCRGMPGGSAASGLACQQRLQVDRLLKRMGCWNIYPATISGASSYWKCRR